MSSVITLLIGICLLLWATNQLVKLASKLAYSLRLSPLVVGVTVVAIGTSLPELIVSTIATLNGDYALAVGNVVGSNIVNILLVFGLGILFGEIKVGTIKTQKTMVYLLTVTLMYILSFNTHIPSTVFFGLAFLFSFLEYRWGVAGRNLEDKIRLKLSGVKPLKTFEYFLIVVYLLGIYLGGTLIINAVETLSKITGYSTHILGLSITAIATSLPEIVTTILSVKQSQEKLLLGNIMGSNVYNILLIGGIANLWIRDFTISKLDIFWLILTMLLFSGITVFYKGRIIPRYVGFILLLFCAAYFGNLYLPSK